MWSDKEIGEIGENIAVRYLIGNDYEIQQRNYRLRMGEIDIIAKDKNEYVFIEVKTRCTRKYGKPAEAVNLKKQKHIFKTANYYICENKLENKIIRFDVIEIYLNHKKAKIKHLKNVEIYSN